MDIWGLTVAALRRWYILLPLLVISLTAAYLVGSRAQAEYEVNGAVMLVVPPQRDPNPYADDYAAEILVIRATSSSTREHFVSQGLTDKYEIDYRRGSPIMAVQVVASSEDVAVSTAEAVVAYLGDTLASAQKARDVPKASLVTLAVVDAPDAAEPVVSGRLRVTAMVAALGVLLSLTCAVLVDVILIRRRNRARRNAVPTSREPGSEPEFARSAGGEAKPTLSES